MDTALGIPPRSERYGITAGGVLPTVSDARVLPEPAATGGDSHTNGRPSVSRVVPSTQWAAPAIKTRQPELVRAGSYRRVPCDDQGEAHGHY